MRWITARKLCGSWTGSKESHLVCQALYVTVFGWWNEILADCENNNNKPEVNWGMM